MPENFRKISAKRFLSTIIAQKRHIFAWGIMRSHAPRITANIHVTCVSKKVSGTEKIAVYFWNNLLIRRS